MRIQIIIIVLAALTSSAPFSSADLPGETLTNKDRRLQKDALRDFDFIAAPRECRKRWQVIHTAVTKSPVTTNDEKEAGVVWTKWEELWTMDLCGTKASYHVRISKRSHSRISLVQFLKVKI